MAAGAGDYALNLAGEAVVLLPERALLWVAQEMLVIADVHWGKAATFRAAAIPVPHGTTADDLAKLSHLIKRTGVRRLVILGDLIHARAGRAEQVLASVAAWRGRHANLEIFLVRGNHDRRAGDPPDSWDIACLDEPFVWSPFVFRHYPQPAAEGYTLAGHLHPAVVLRGRGRQQEKLACFWFGAQVGVLPAFGSFTGTLVVRPQAGDQVYGLTEEVVVSLPAGGR